MDFKPVVIAPTFNNAGTLLDVLSRVDLQGVAAIAVNDGSTDDTAALLETWRRLPGETRYVETHPKNLGKAAALQTGFAAALRLGFTHALSIDTDGQLSPEQIPQMLALARENPASLVLGVRDASAADYPWRSRLGRRAANLLIFMESGLRVADSQCGLRVYPLAMAELVECRAGRYGFETEVIVRAGWGGRSVAEMPARCTYFAGERRVSHFRPWVDSLRAAGMHLRLVARRLLPFDGSRGNEADGTDKLRDPHWRRGG
jgi:glycosyltransferase involved in cell wall biosynthesis